jgi:hypothetical protein
MSGYSRILVCGGRSFDDEQHFQNVMDAVKPFFAEKFCIIHGGANGADKMAGRWAMLQGLPMMVIPANWTFYQLGAGTLRNTWMLDWGLPDCVIALPGNKGTANMVKQALARKIMVFK